MPQHFFKDKSRCQSPTMLYTHWSFGEPWDLRFPINHGHIGREFYFLVQVCDDVFQCLYFEKHYISYPGPIGGIGFCCSCGCIAGDLESGVRFFWCLSNRSRPSSSHHIESKPEEENSKIQHLKKYILKSLSVSVSLCLSLSNMMQWWDFCLFAFFLVNICTFIDTNSLFKTVKQSSS